MEPNERRINKGSNIYLMVTILCLIIIVIYYQFSHGVTSPFMSFLFLWPLMLGFIPTRIIEKQLEKRAPGRLTLNIYNSGVAALTVSSLLKGIFDIAGNSSRYQIYLLIFGSIMFITGLFLYIRERVKHTS